jgi:tetratricopeptide (TPR) repeat protein
MKIKTLSSSVFLTLFCLFQLSSAAIANEIEALNKATNTNKSATTLDTAVPAIDAESLFQSGLAHYKNEKYDEAIKQLKRAVKMEPEEAEYHHILAVSYGREAENVNWFKAMDYAKRTLTHLKKSDELDPNNLEILDDLMDFYHEAPGFLGGDMEKGDEIEALIEKLSRKSQQ